MKTITIALAAAALLGLGAVQAFGQAAPAQAPVAWRDVDPENILVIETNKGRIIAELFPAAAPKHVERIKILTRQGLYDGRTFFRVIDGFMAQTGDPENNGRGGSTLPNLSAEFTFRRGRDLPFSAIPSDRGFTGFSGAFPILSQPEAQMAITADGKVQAQGLHCKGTLSMARAADVDSANSQFFMMRAKTDNLNGKYTPFGRILLGLDIVQQIKTGEPVAEPQDLMQTVRVLADLPAATRPKIRVQQTSGPEYAAYVQAQRTAKGGAFDICDLDIAVQVQ